MFKNVASQKIALFAFTLATGAAKTGDAANITAYVSKDAGAVTVLGDTSATEMDATNAPGWYLFDLTQGETNGDDLLFTAKSATAGVSIVGRPITTVPNRFSSMVIDAAGLVDATAVKAGPSGAATALTARDIGASVLLSAGTGTGQLDFTSGVVKSNVTQFNGSAATSASGRPEVNVSHFGGTAGTFASGRPEVNATHAAGTAWNSGAITRASFAADTGLASARSATAQAGAAGTITLDASASATTDFYKGSCIVITGGTGVGQYRVCSAYNGSTKVASVTPAWATNPDNTSTFAVMPYGMTDVEAWLGAAAPAMTGDAYARLGAPAGASVSADIAAVKAVLPAALVSGRMDASVGAYQSGQTPLQPTVAGRTLDVSAGGEAGLDWANVGSPTTTLNLSGTTIATVSGAVGSVSGLTASDIAAIKAKTDSLTFTVAGMVDSNVIDWKSSTAPAMTGDAFARLGAPIGASISADIAGVQSDTDNIQTRLPAALGANGNLKADVRDYNGSAGAFASGRPEVNVSHIAGAAVSTGTAQIGVNVVNFGGAAGTFAAGRPEVNTSHAAGTAWNSGAIGPSTLAADTITAAKVAADVSTEIWSAATRTLTAGTNIVLAKGTGVTGFNDLDAAGVRGAVGLASANVDTQLGAISAKTGNLPSDPADASDIASAFGAVNSTLVTIASYIDTEVGAIKTVTDKLDDTLEDAGGGNFIFTEAALAQAPSGTGASAATIADAVWDEALSDHTIAGSAGDYLTASGNKPDPWGIDLPGSYDSGTAGDILGALTPAAVAVAMLTLDWNDVSGEPDRCVLQALRHIRNKWDTTSVPGFVVVRKEDDTTEAWRAALTTSGSAEPITGSDPT